MLVDRPAGTPASFVGCSYFSTEGCITIKIGFIGTGLISHMHLAFLMTSSEPNRVVAVHDVDPDRARAFASLCGASVVGVDELFDAVDLVYVTTWTSEHPSLVRAAADRGVAVYCPPSDMF